MKRIVVTTAVLIVLFFSWYYMRHPLSSKVKIRDTVFTVDIAATDEQKELGLGGRATMAADRGMLFPYDHKEQFEFWMKGMQFPLDFIWIDGKTVADITVNIPPPIGNEQPIVVKPKVQVDKVLEVNAETLARTGIQIGDSVEFIDR